MEIQYLKANDILLKTNELNTDFTVRANLQVIERIPDITRPGNPYFHLVLGDITRKVRAVKFAKDSEELEALRNIFEIGNIVNIVGLYGQRFASINISEERILNRNEFNLNNFIAQSNVNIDTLVEFLGETIESIQNDKLKTLLIKIFEDDDIKTKYIKCPSSVGQHHSYKYGNLEHTISMIRMFRELEQFYNRNTNLDVDLIYTGIILHDIGKINEFTTNNDLPIRTGMGLIGHVNLGADLVLRFIREINDFPKDLENRILHLILSHHGRKEWGTVVVPLFTEAEILHYLDMIDSRFKKIE